MAARLFPVAAALTAILALSTRPAAAQDNHYWRDSYGTEATLLSGAVIGRALDMSAAFYNPAGVATLSQASLLISAHVYEYSGVTVEGTDQFTGLPLNVGTSSLRPAASFVGGTIPFEWLGRHRLGYSILTRQATETRLAYRRGEMVGDDLVQVEYLNDNELNEVWAGVTWAWPMSSRAAIGASLFAAVRNQLLRRQVTGQVLYDDDTVGMASGISEFDYDSWRLVPKLGTLVDLRPLTLGATVTVPSLGLWGGGSAFYNATATGIDFGGDGTDDTRLTADYQEDLASDFASGLSVGLGAALDVGRTTLFGSAEWFAERGPTRVLATEPFVSQRTGEPAVNDLVLKSKSVVNVGFGVRHRFTDRLAGYVSGSTDRASMDTTLAVSLGRRPWDLYHVGGGVKFTIRKIEFVLGGTWSWGDAEAQVDNPTDIPELATGTISLRETGFRGLFGFQFGFGKDRADETPGDATGP